jgi:hypothetical protein
VGGVRPEGLRRSVHGGQEWEAMPREIKKDMYQAASFTGDLGEAGILALARREERPVSAPEVVAV